MTSKNPIINFIFLEPSWKKLSKTLKDDVRVALETASDCLKKDFSRMEVSIVFSSNAEVQSLNKEFRKKNKPTNVLSFPSKENEELGDIILAYETILEEAHASDILPLDHTLHLIIHGFLHLIGYDHEKEDDAYHMEQLEIEILKQLNINNPYEDQ